MIRLPWPFPLLEKKTRPRPPGDPMQLQVLEYHGASFLARLTSAIKEESWKHRLLALAWTAGPVTILALFIGFSIGYGRKPPSELYIYFGAYTVITGLVSLVVGVVHRATVAARRKEVENTLSEVISKIPDLIVSLRNLGTFTLSGEERRIRGAIYLLSDPDATESSIETAAEDLTGSVVLARRFRRLEAFRKKGLMGLVKEEGDEIQLEYQQLLPEIRRRSSHAAALLESRLAGRIPSKRLGLRRRYGFITRMITAVEEGDLDRMEFADTEDLLKLILELLMDRRFVILRWRLAGEHPLVVASRGLDRIGRNRQRLARRRRLAKYRVIEILDRIVNEPPTPFQGKDERELAPTGETEGLFPFTLAAMPDFRDLDAIHSYRGPYQSELRENLERIERTTEALNRVRGLERKERKKFRAQSRLFRGDFTRTDEGGEEKPPIQVRFIRDTLRFSDEEKIEFTNYLNYYLANLNTNRERTRVLAESGGDESEEDPRPLAAAELKSIVLRVFAKLERLLDLSEEAVIDSLEASAAINVSAIEYHLSRRTKIGWLQAMVEEIEESVGSVALRTAERLVDRLQCPLPPTVAKTLGANYHLPVEKLRALAPKPITGSE